MKINNHKVQQHEYEINGYSYETDSCSFMVNEKRRRVRRKIRRINKTALEDYTPSWINEVMNRYRSLGETVTVELEDLLNAYDNNQS